MSSAAADSLELHLASARIGRAFRRRAARKELAEQRALMTASEEADIPDGGEALKKHYMEEHGKVPAGRILGLCFSDIPIIAGIIFLSIVQIFATVGFFLSFALFVDDLTTVDANSNKAAVVSTSLLVTMLIISVIMSLLIMGKSILLNAGANTLAIRMRKQLLYAVAMRPISWFDRNRIADISNSLGPAVSLITEGVFQAIVNSWWAFVMIITCMVVLGLLNVKSMLITLAVLVLAFTTFIQTEIKEKYYKDLNQAVTQSDVELTEFVSRIRPIRAAATERKEMEDYTSRVELAADLRKRMAFIDGIFDGVNTFIAAAVLLVLLWFDGGLVEDGKMSVGKLITAIAVGGVIMTYFRLLFKNIGGCISTVDSCQVGEERGLRVWGLRFRVSPAWPGGRRELTAVGPFCRLLARRPKPKGSIFRSRPGDPLSCPEGLLGRRAGRSIIDTGWHHEACSSKSGWYGTGSELENHYRCSPVEPVTPPTLHLLGPGGTNHVVGGCGLA
mmetsp:Transcript_54736/g.173816  ORF Transcript_54736/g.173816 Transcript_54736/m.173816 type:complete len:503 (-) Transcript_54736:1439-2947(-)